MKFTKIIRKSIALAGCSVTISVGFSQDVIEVTADAGAGSGEAVSAFKTETPLIDIPESASIMTAQEIADQGISTIGEIVDYTPGVITSQGEGHRDSVVFRGNRSTASFYVDGLRDDVQYYRSLYNVEQVEVLKGANALFFGRGGNGGVINRSTKKASFDSDFTNYFGSVNSFGGTELQLDHNQVITDNTAFRFNAHVDQLQGHRDFFEGNRVGVNPTVTHFLTDDTSVTFSYEFINHSRFIDRGIPTDASGDPVESLDDVVFGDPDLNVTELEAHVIKATLNHDFGNGWKAEATTSFGTYDKLYQNFYAADYDEATDIVTIDGYRDTTQRDRFELSGELIGEVFTGNIEHNLVIGADFTYTSNDNDRFNTFFDTSADDQETFLASSFRLNNGAGVNSDGVTSTNSFNTDLNDETRATVTTYGLFVQDEIAVNDYLDVILGARFDSFKIEGDNVAGNSSFSQTDTFVAPRAGLVFKPTEDLSLYASYSQTFLPNSGEQFASISANELDFDPDEYTNIEVGVKWNVTQDLFLTAAVFDLETSTVVSDGGTGSERRESTATGVELAAKGYLTDQWYISAGYTYLDNETAGGARQQESPEHTFSIWNQYKANDKLSFGLGVIYQDESIADIDATNGGILPSYVRVDASATYKFAENYTVGLHVENLLNTDYFPNSHDDHQVSVGAPLNATLSVRGSF